MADFDQRTDVDERYGQAAPLWYFPIPDWPNLSIGSDWKVYFRVLPSGTVEHG
ncbi:MAG: hypothetical protein ACRYGI_11440 [Janthinobacterium lividum]